jgi:hypothetical protein
MTLDDAVFNWLQIKYVAKMRPDDQAAQETYAFFTQLLEEDHRLQEITVSTEDQMYLVQFLHEGKRREKKFPCEFVHQLYHDLEEGPHSSSCS